MLECSQSTYAHMLLTVKLHISFISHLHYSSVLQDPIWLTTLCRLGKDLD